MDFSDDLEGALIPGTEDQHIRGKEDDAMRCAYASAFFGVAFFGVAFFVGVFLAAAAFFAGLEAGALVLVTRPDLVLPRMRAGSSVTAGAY